ncbi:hypothetical protein A6A40_24515 (plasmid) [Azospirillum humicireducens]|uniref:AAA+ ATPase domain-containing protein n=1 Tax=Azospirillum humicireducens TaxID=1226968 RepID=A0A2R4VUU9_9PROT|nr:AAA family ATPase [Azospirillum humicireducens]AWB08192.1 hypothetical protein A6A40_24515 [Azospirillum humicireducens]
MSTEDFASCRFRYVHDPETNGRIRIYLEEAPFHAAMMQEPAAYGLERAGSHPPFLAFGAAAKPDNIADARRRAQAWAEAHGRPVQEQAPRAASVPPNSRTDMAVDLDEIKRLRRPRAAVDAATLYDEIRDRVRGQDDAVAAMADEVARHVAKIQPRRPLSLFMVGPTGVGKTLSARCLADALSRQCGSDYGWLRIDMCEYQESYRISQLLGSPQGYVGHGDGAQLTDALRRNPRTVVLFDEIEKAHPSIFKTLMNAMDAGRLSTPASHDGDWEIDCRQAIFCFTSNLGAAGILEDLRRQNGAGDPQAIDGICRNRLRSGQLPSELIGRITRFLPFQAIGEDVRAAVIALSIRDLGSEYDLDVVRIEPEAIALVLAEAQDNVFGARPDEYLVDRLLGLAFAAAQKRGNRAVAVAVRNGNPIVEPESPA